MMKSVVSRPRFGGDSQARTLVYSYTSAGQEPAGKAQLDRDQLYRARQVLGRKGFLIRVNADDEIPCSKSRSV